MQESSKIVVFCCSLTIFCRISKFGRKRAQNAYRIGSHIYWILNIYSHPSAPAFPHHHQLSGLLLPIQTKPTTMTLRSDLNPPREERQYIVVMYVPCVLPAARLPVCFSKLSVSQMHFYCIFLLAIPNWLYKLGFKTLNIHDWILNKPNSNEIYAKQKKSSIETVTLYALVVIMRVEQYRTYCLSAHNRQNCNIDVMMTMRSV